MAVLPAPRDSSHPEGQPRGSESVLFIYLLPSISCYQLSCHIFIQVKGARN